MKVVYTGHQPLFGTAGPDGHTPLQFEPGVPQEVPDRTGAWLIGRSDFDIHRVDEVAEARAKADAEAKAKADAEAAKKAAEKK